MTALGWERAGLALTVYFAALAAGRFRAAQKQQVLLKTPLFDAAILEAVLHPRLQDGDDAALLTKLREEFTSTNRQAYAEEFFSLHTQIAMLFQMLAPTQAATLHRAVLRLLMSGDYLLQGAGAQIAADLQLAETYPLIEALLNKSGVSHTRSRQVLEEALTKLTGGTYACNHAGDGNSCAD